MRILIKYKDGTVKECEEMKTYHGGTMFVEFETDWENIMVSYDKIEKIVIIPEEGGKEK